MTQLATPTRPVIASGDQATRLRALMDAACAQPTPAPHQPSPDHRTPPRPLPVPRQRSARVIGIASGKGGVGKTNIAVNLAIALAARGPRITLLDADLGTANADVLCGLTPAARLSDIVTRRDLHLDDIAIDAPGGFRLVPGSAGLSHIANLAPDDRARLVAAVADLESEADAILIDTAAGIGAGVTSFLAASDLAVVVCTPEPTAIADAYALIKCIHAETAAAIAPSRAPIALLVNQAASEEEARAVHARIAGVCERFLGLPLQMLGSVAQDLRVREAVRARRPLMLTSPRCPASRDISRIADELRDRLVLSDGPETLPRPGRRLSALFARLVGRHGG